VNFKRLLEFNASKLPFAAAQIGQAYRNEIAPRSGLLRVREFTLAEIEHFVHPEDKKHPKYSSIADVVLTLFPREQQEGSKKTIEMSIREAVEKVTPLTSLFIDRCAENYQQ
jgi:glycyl-tRNA synthetase